MSRFVVDASVAIKWVITEPDSAEATTLRLAEGLLAPDLLIAEVANVLWKLVRRGELSTTEAELAARLIERAPLELRPMRSLLAPATQLAISLDHPAYDCIYLALAAADHAPLVTADERLLRKLAATSVAGIEVVSLIDAARQLQP